MNRQRAIVALLTVFCVLLALNLLKGEPEAQAQHGPPDTLFAEPTVIAGAVDPGGELDRIYRFWTDGTVDVSVRFYADVATCAITDSVSCGPVEVILGP